MCLSVCLSAGSLCKTSPLWLCMDALQYLFYSFYNIVITIRYINTAFINNWFQFSLFLLIDKSCFSTLFNHEDMQEIIRHLPFCHVEAPGQHEGAKTLPTAWVQSFSDSYLLLFNMRLIVYSKWSTCWWLRWPFRYTYPTMDQLSEALPAVLKHFG